MIAKRTHHGAEEIALAADLRAHAGGVVRAAVASLRAGDRTIATRIIAARLVERYSSALARRDWQALYTWVDVACERYAGIVPVADTIDATMRGIAAAAGPNIPVRDRVAQIAARPRMIKNAARHEALDEIDVLLDNLVMQLGQNDVLTAEHSQAVSVWCERLGTRLGLDKAQIVRLGRCGLIHDIGKITTPPEILSAPRFLDEAEMEIMRDHAQRGAVIVAEMPLIAHLVPGVRSHHERMDGSGYPDKIGGLAIPHLARVVSVADAFNAMIGRRPYRAPIAPSVALQRLVDCRGTQFDPDVVDAMIEVLQGPAAPLPDRVHTAPL